MSQPVTSLLSSTNHEHNPTTPPTETTTWHLMPTTTHERPITTTSQTMKTTAHKWHWTPTKTNNCPAHEWRPALWMDTGDDTSRSASSLPPPPLSSLTWDAGATIAISDMAMKQWTMTKNCCLLLLLGHHSKSLGSSQTTWIRHSMTTDWWHGQDRDNNDDTAQRRGCPMTPMWNEEMTRTHNNDMQLGNDNMRKDDDKGPGPPTNSDDFPSPSPSPSPSPFPSPSPSLHHLPSLHPPSLHPPSPQHPPSLLHPPSPLHLPSL